MKLLYHFTWGQSVFVLPQKITEILISLLYYGDFDICRGVQ